MKKTDIVIFLGPSLQLSKAEKILDAIYLPPAKQSDLISAVNNYQPKIIGLIDGVFFKCPSVWHKEILYAMQQGVAVYGASSMGALRAAETDIFGMVGVGQVYQMYASGELIDDDEVVLVHAPASSNYLPLSEAMINIRATLQRARQQEIIEEEVYEKLLKIAKSIYFTERTLAAIFNLASAQGIAQPLLDKVFKENYVDIKQQDAILLLKTIGDLDVVEKQQSSNFQLAVNHFFHGLYYRDRRVTRQGIDVPLGNIVSYAALHDPDFEDINFNALNRSLVQLLAQMMKLEVSKEEIEKEKRRFRLKHNLTQDINFSNWLLENNLSAEEYEELIKEMAVCRKLQKILLSKKGYEKNTKIYLDELRLLNHYQEWADAAAKQEQILEEHEQEFADQNMTMSQLIVEHLRSTDCSMNINYKDWSFEAGFLDFDCLKLELSRSRLVRKLMQDLTLKMFKEELKN